MHKLSVIIPAYNEAARIGATLADVADYLGKQSYLSEIIVVNDGSKDKTAEVVRGMKTKVKNLELIDNTENKGKGGVVRQGMLAGSGDVRVFMDADNSTRIQEIGAFLPYFDQGFDLVVGSRRISGSHITKHQPWIRDLQGSVFRGIVHLFVPLNVTDSQCGFKAFSASACQIVFPKQTVFRWAFDVELLAIARLMNMKIKELPVTWVNDEATRVRFMGKVHMLLEVLKVRLQLWQGVYR